MKTLNHQGIRLVAVSAMRRKVKGRDVVRLSFNNDDKKANYASNALVAFLLTLVDDDREFGFGLLNGGKSNYVDIPTKPFEDELRAMEKAA